MGDSNFFDVIIGLTLIFFLFSLLVSAIQEGLSRIFRARALVLEEAILVLLGGDKNWLQVFKDHPRYKTLIPYNGDLEKVSWVSKCFRRLSNLFNHPRKARPSYISSNTFAKIFAGTLDSYLFNEEKQEYQELDELETEILEKIKKIADGDTSDLENKITKLKQRTKLPLANKGLNHFLKDHEKLSNFSIQEDEDGKTKIILTDILKNSQNSESLFQKQVEDWFNDTMDRVSGWYKRRAQFSLLLIGFIVAMIFNVNPIFIAKHLNESNEYQKILVRAAEGFVAEGSSPDQDFKIGTYLGLLEKSFETQNKRVDIAIDSTIKDLEATSGSVSEKKKADIKKLLSKLKEDLKRFPDSTLEGQPSLNEFIARGEEIGQAINNIQNYSAVLGIGWNSETLEREEFGFWSILKETLFNIPGYFLFAIAMALGASFWFDLLKLFVRIRHTGVKPGEGSNSSSNISGTKIYG